MPCVRPRANSEAGAPPRPCLLRKWRTRLGRAMLLARADKRAACAASTHARSMGNKTYIVREVLRASTSDTGHDRSARVECSGGRPSLLAWRGTCSLFLSTCRTEADCRAGMGRESGMYTPAKSRREKFSQAGGSNRRGRAAAGSTRSCSLMDWATAFLNLLEVRRLHAGHIGQARLLRMRVGGRKHIIERLGGLHFGVILSN